MLFLKFTYLLLSAISYCVLLEGVNQFPLLSEVARRILCITASSAQSERDFSSVGGTITDAGSRLNPSKVETLEIVRWAFCSAIIHAD